MPKPFACSVLFPALTIALLVATPIVAAPTAQQREEALGLMTSIKLAGNLYSQGKYKESVDVVRDVQAKVEKLTADGNKDMIQLLEPVFTRLKNAHGLLELEGYTLPPLKDPGTAPPEVAKPADPGKPPATPAPPPAGGAISFVNHVAPILIGKCGRCHVNDMKGRFSMATFAALKKGPPDGVVFFPGDSAGSRLIEVIESGDMPRGGGKIAPAELATLKKWIDEGAKFDGNNETANLVSLAPGAKPEEVPQLAVVQSTGKETISFARDVAPVLAKTCMNCHGTNRPRNNLNMNTFTSLLKGGDSGAPIAPGKPADSLLVKKLKGTADGQRMPANQPPLADDVIAKIEKWIQEGATFDGPDAAQDIAQVAALARAQAATHEELSADRAQQAAQNWQLGMPDIQTTQVQTKNFLLLGNVGENTLNFYGEQAEAMAPKVAAIFKAAADQPLLKGRMTLYFFQQRYDYSEFGKMVERRDIPAQWRGHWNYNIVDAYGAIIPPRDGEYGLDILIAQQLAGAYVASLGRQVPRWFSEGAGRVAASRLGPKDARVTGWDEQLPQILASMAKADDFLTGKLPPESADVASFSFVEHLMSNAKQFDALLGTLRKGESFDKAFAMAYGGNPSQLTDVWARTAAKKPATRRVGAR